MNKNEPKKFVCHCGSETFTIKYCKNPMIRKELVLITTCVRCKKTTLFNARFNIIRHGLRGIKI